MNNNLELLTNKLKNAPQNIVEQVIGYADALVALDKKPFILSEKQQELLDQQLNLDKKNYNSAEKLFQELKHKYEL